MSIASPTDQIETDSLEALGTAVENAAAVTTGLWLSYLFTLFYFAVAAAAVTHVDLLLENSVKLPFLGIELPLTAFFLVAPILFLIVHAYTLLHFVLLGEKITRFQEILYSDFPGTDAAPTSDSTGRHNELTRDRVRLKLPINIFVQFLAGPKDVRGTSFGFLLKGIALITLVVAPVLLLLELQIQFLPYHDLTSAWAVRIVLLADVLLIWWLWRRLLDGERKLVKVRAYRPWISKKIDRFFRTIRRATPALWFILSIMVVWFSWCVAVIPGEWQRIATKDSLYQFWFHGEVDPNTHRRLSLFSNTLVLPGFNIYEILKVDDPKKITWRDYLISLQGRDLRGAVFDQAFLERVNARNARLEGASFKYANLQGAKLRDANLQQAHLGSTSLQGAELIRAHLEGTEFIGTALQGANLESAYLIGADLSLAQLQGANLHGANMQGTSFNNANLRGASFGPLKDKASQLQGATFVSAKLDTVSLDGALLFRAEFSDADMHNIFGTPVWTPKETSQRVWGPRSYDTLRKNLGDLPDVPAYAVVARIEALDCESKNPDLASCNPLDDDPDTVKRWQEQMKNASLDQSAYAKDLADIYFHLMCSGGGESLYIFRSLVSMSIPQVGENAKPMGILETGNETGHLVDRISKEKCPLVNQLADGDKANLATVTRLTEPDEKAQGLSQAN